MPAREQCRIGRLRLGEVLDRAGREVHPPHRARVPRGHRNPVAARGVPYTRDQPGGSPLQGVVEPRPLRLAQRGEARGHGHRIPCKRRGLIDRPFRCDEPHQVRAPTVRSHRHSAADEDRKSTRLNSSHVKISYAVFCLKKKKKNKYILFFIKKKKKKKNKI